MSIKFDLYSLIGKKINEWEILKYDEYRTLGVYKGKAKKAHFYICECSCGEIRSVQIDNILKSKSKSCGHKNRERFKNELFKHGLSRDRLYRIYKEMIKRCTNKKSKDYCRYGEIGIQVCEEWLNDFYKFQSWAKDNGYKENLSIERVDVNGNYEPSNCKWATMKEQSLNRRNSITIKAISPLNEIYDNIKDIKSFCIEHNLKSVSKVYSCINGKISKYRGWKFEKIDKKNN